MIYAIVTLYLWEHLKEAERLLMGLRQWGDEAALFPCAPKEHASPPDAPHGAAARLQAARLPTCRPTSPVRQRVPAEGDDAAPVDPEHPASHPAEVTRHTWTKRQRRFYRKAERFWKHSVFYVTVSNQSLRTGKGWRIVGSDDVNNLFSMQNNSTHNLAWQGNWWKASDNGNVLDPPPPGSDSQAFQGFTCLHQSGHCWVLLALSTAQGEGETHIQFWSKLLRLFTD